MSHINTKCVQEGWHPKNGEPRVLPIYQSTTFKYDTTQTMGDLFDLKAEGHFYTRLSNPTLEAVENKIAALEGGIGAMVTSSGQAASLVSVLTICKSGDHVVASAAIYGGTFNLFNVTLRELGIDFSFVSPDATEEELEAQIKPNTKLVFGETLSNPSLAVLDIERFASVAHRHQIPLIVDNTFPTPINCRPISFGADIVTHSTSKYMDGHATVLGGVIVDSGNFDWSATEKYPMLTTPDDSYHGIVFCQHFGKAAYIFKARTQLMRDFGVQASPNSGFLLNLGLETLALRVERHCQNAQKIAEFLHGSEHVEWVRYPGLPSDPYYALAQKYMPSGTSGVISFAVKGGRQAAARFIDSLKLIAQVTHVADVRSCILHPASTTHRQLTDEQLIASGTAPDLMRLSVGIEDAGDLIDDIKQALGAL